MRREMGVVWRRVKRGMAGGDERGDDVGGEVEMIRRNEELEGRKEERMREEERNISRVFLPHHIYLTPDFTYKTYNTFIRYRHTVINLPLNSV